MSDSVPDEYGVSWLAASGEHVRICVRSSKRCGLLSRAMGQVTVSMRMRILTIQTEYDLRYHNGMDLPLE